jgi:phosphoenolpyruvate phosphomutase
VMLPVAGKPLVRGLADAFKKEGVNDITIVGGYRADAIANSTDSAGIKVVVNERYAESDELVSLATASKALSSDVVIAYGDLLFRSYILRDLVESDATFTVVVDSSAPHEGNATVRDFAYCSAPDDRDLFGRRVTLEHVSNEGAAGDRRANGRWIGLLAARGEGPKKLRDCLATLQKRPDFDRLDMPALLNALAESGEQIAVQYVHGHWRGVNDLEDFRLAADFAHQGAAGAPPAR